MKYILTLLFLFISGATIGWGIELLFRRFFTAKKWINPGFLMGPYLPIYGFGLCVLFAIASIDINFITSYLWLQAIIKIAFMTFVVTLFEYIGGIIFIKGMNIKLWDYSDRKGNINGIVCPLFTFFWALIATIYCLFIHKEVIKWVAWFENNVAFSLFVGIILGAIIVDLSYSIHLATIIKKAARDRKFVIHYEKLKYAFNEKLKESRVTRLFLFPFKTIGAIGESVRNYIDAQKNRGVTNDKKEKDKAN